MWTEWVGVGWTERVALTYPLPCVKQIASRKLFCSTGSSTLCSVMAWHAEGREAHEGGDISIHITFTLLYNRNWHNIVTLEYPPIKKLNKSYGQSGNNFRSSRYTGSIEAGEERLHWGAQLAEMGGKSLPDCPARWATAGNRLFCDRDCIAHSCRWLASCWRASSNAFSVMILLSCVQW